MLTVAIDVVTAMGVGIVYWSIRQYGWYVPERESAILSLDIDKRGRKRVPPRSVWSPL
jgi:hypothetical protein